MSTIITWRSRATGTMLTCGTADDLDCDPDGGKWVTICEKHGTLINSSTLAIARATWSTDFCDDCRDEHETR
jgi:hypothetical protein